MIVAAEHYLRYCNRDGQAWERVLPLLRAKFWENKQRQRTPGEIRLAIHMRRGDVSAADKKVANNFTPNATFVNTLTRLKAVLGDRAPALRVEVFSQGDPAMFADLAALGARLRLDEPALDTHRALVEADILVMSKGAYSYTAAVLHEGSPCTIRRNTARCRAGSCARPTGLSTRRWSPAAWRRCSARQVSHRRTTTFCPSRRDAIESSRFASAEERHNTKTARARARAVFVEH